MCDGVTGVIGDSIESLILSVFKVSLALRNGAGFLRSFSLSGLELAETSEASLELDPEELEPEAELDSSSLDFCLTESCDDSSISSTLEGFFTA